VVTRAADARELLGASSEEREPTGGWGAFPWAGAGDGQATALKATFALSGLARVLAAARSSAEEAGVALHLRGSGGAGVLYAAVAAGVEPAAVRSVVERLRAACAAVGGALIVLDAPPEVKAAVDTWGPVPASDLMERVKDQFDPERRLAPGRFVGGI
jgi:glycolate oxidase FAD binding subunit